MLTKHKKSPNQIHKKNKVVTKENLTQARLLSILMRSKIPRNLRVMTAVPTRREEKVAWKQNYIFKSAVNPYYVYDFCANGAFNPDPTLALVPGSFAFYANGYAFYIVDNFRIRFTASANEPALALSFGLTMKDYRPGTSIISYEDAVGSLAITPATRQQSIGETTGASVYRSPEYEIHPAAILGNALQYYAAPTYAAAVTANPASILWCSFVVIPETPTGTFPNGMKVDIELEYDVTFYSNAIALL